MTPTESTAPVLASVDDALTTARAVAAEIAAGAVERELTGAWPVQELHRVSESGLLGIIVPSGFGGPDLPPSTAVEVLRILSQADSAVGQLLLSHFVINFAIRGLGTADPAPRVYGDVVAGTQVGNATVERGTRTSADRLTTVSRRDGDSWVLNGKEYYATGALEAGWIAVAARIPDTEPPHGATVFVRRSDHC